MAELINPTIENLSRATNSDRGTVADSNNINDWRTTSRPLSSDKYQVTHRLTIFSNRLSSVNSVLVVNQRHPSDDPNGHTLIGAESPSISTTAPRRPIGRRRRYAVRFCERHVHSLRPCVQLRPPHSIFVAWNCDLPTFSKNAPPCNIAGFRRRP